MKGEKKKQKGTNFGYFLILLLVPNFYILFGFVDLSCISILPYPFACTLFLFRWWVLFIWYWNHKKFLLCVAVNITLLIGWVLLQLTLFVWRRCYLFFKISIIWFHNIPLVSLYVNVFYFFFLFTSKETFGEKKWNSLLNYHVTG